MIYFPLKNLPFWEEGHYHQTHQDDDKYRFKFPASGVEFNLAENIAIMGVLNVSPDSFYIGFGDEKRALQEVEKLVEGGADIIDVGGQSTRPGSDEIPEEEEINRIKIIGKIRKMFPKVPISVDTYRSEVAKVAFDLGADMLNDISGFRFSPDIVDVCKEFRAPAVVMHTTAKPKVMQETTLPDEILLDEIKKYLLESVRIADENGIKVMVDPGIGFGKKPHQNLMIINGLTELLELSCPILLGPSRKSFIGFALSRENPPPPQERLEGTISACVLGVERGARVFRVHDPGAVWKALKVAVSVLMEKF